MKHIKKYFVLILALGMILSTQAVASTASEATIMEEQIQLEVDAKVQSRLNEVQHLFEGRDPGYLDVYTEYLTAYYEQLILQERGITPLYEPSYRLDNGGAASYTTVDAAGDHFDVVVLMLDKEDSYDYLLNNWSPDGVGVDDLFLDALGYVPVLGTIAGSMLDILDGVEAVSGQSEWESIQAAGGYVMVETVRCREYPYNPISMIRGWSLHPYYVPPTSLPSNLNINVIEFN